MRILFALVGYLCTATVIAVAAGMAYLWNSGLLSDEKAFRIVALVHDVDLSRVETTESKPTVEAPGEEPSTEEQQRAQEIALLNYDAKISALDRGRGEYQHMLRQLVEARDRFDDMARELEERIRAETDATTKESVASVVRDLKSVSPEVAKDLLLRVLNRGKDEQTRAAAQEDVIRLMSALPQNTLTDILERFQSEEEKQKLHELHLLELQGGPKQRALDEALRQIGDRRADN